MNLKQYRGLYDLALEMSRLSYMEGWSKAKLDGAETYGYRQEFLYARNQFLDDLSKINQQDKELIMDLQKEIPRFNEEPVRPVYNLEHQISLLRSVNQSYKDQINSLSSENMVLKARVSILLSMLCDAGIPLPPDIE